MVGELQGGSSLSLEGVEERYGGEYVCQVSTIGQLIATSFHLDIQGNTSQLLDIHGNTVSWLYTR